MRAAKVRIRFAKQGDLRFISHHDLMRCWERMLRRAAVPIAHSQGFAPRPKMVFAAPLALGIASEGEVVDLELDEPLDPEELRGRLQAVAPPGLTLLAAEPPEDGRGPRPAAAAYELEVPEPRRPAAAAALAEFLARERWPYTRHREGRRIERDVRGAVRRAELGEAGRLSFTLTIDQAGSVRPEELLEVLGLRDLLEQGAVLRRTRLDLVASPAGGAPRAPSPAPP